MYLSITYVYMYTRIYRYVFILCPNLILAASTQHLRERHLASHLFRSDIQQCKQGPQQKKDP